MLSHNGLSVCIGLLLTFGSTVREVSGFRLSKIAAPRELFASSSKKTSLVSLMSTTTTSADLDIHSATVVEPSKEGELFDWNKQVGSVCMLGVGGRARMLFGAECGVLCSTSPRDLQIVC